MRTCDLNQFLLCICFTFLWNGNGIVGSSNPNTNCSIFPVDSEIRDNLLSLLEDGKTIVFYHLSFPDQPNPFGDHYDGNLYRPMDWVRTVGRHGRGLLFLRPQFQELSLTTLSLMTATIDVPLTASPNGCLLHLNSTVFEHKLRRLLMSDFTPDGHPSISEREHICNCHIRNDNTLAKFVYQCCNKDIDGDLHCKDLNKDFWIDVLFTCIYGINFLALMFCPYLIPTRFYRDKYESKHYEYNMEETLEGNKELEDEIKAKIDPSGSKKIRKVRKIIIKVPNRRLVPANKVPVGILNAIETMFLKCNIGKIEPFYRCCGASIRGKCFDEEAGKDSKSLEKECSWYRCLRVLMKCLMLLAISLPWIARLIFYNTFEGQHSVELKQAAEARNLTFPITWNLTNSLSPIHWLFLCCYAIIVIDVLVFGVVSVNVSSTLKLLMKKYKRHMNSTSKTKVFQWAVLIIFLPFEKLGIFGIFIFGIHLVFAIPAILIVFTIFCLPTAYLVFQVVKRFIIVATCNHNYTLLNEDKGVKCFFHLDYLFKRTKNKSEHDNIKAKELIVLSMCLLTICSVAILAMEVIVFLVEVFLYTIIGIIINAMSVLKYLSFLFMLGFYARDCFYGVSQKYHQFNKTLNSLVVNMVKTKVEKVAENSAEKQEPTAFRIDKTI